MQGIENLLISVILAVAQGTTSLQFPNWQSSWIERGSYATIGEFPYLVSLRTVVGDRHFCGGTIINQLYILTAAHCLSGETTASFIVVVGTDLLNSGGKIYDVSGIILHPAFNKNGVTNDVGLIRLAQPVIYSPTVGPVSLPSQDEIADLGTVCIFGGWGLIAEEGPMSTNLQKLQISIVSNSECQQYNSYFSDTKLCARAPPGMGICKGDSGGPLICAGEQIGILTGGGPTDKLCKTDYPLDYVYVSKYINWITQTAV